MKTYILSLLFIFSAIGAIAQTDTSVAPSVDTINTAKIYVLRSTGFAGSAVNFRVIVDSTTYCKVRNNRHSIIYVPAGEHAFYATTWDAPNSKDKLALKMVVEAGKTYYLSMRMKQRFFENQLFFEEVTYNTAAPLIEKLKRDDKCD